MPVKGLAANVHAESGYPFTPAPGIATYKPDEGVSFSDAATAEEKEQLEEIVEAAAMAEAKVTAKQAETKKLAVRRQKLEVRERLVGQQLAIPGQAAQQLDHWKQIANFQFLDTDNNLTRQMKLEGREKLVAEQEALIAEPHSKVSTAAKSKSNGSKQTAITGLKSKSNILASDTRPFNEPKSKVVARSKSYLNIVVSNEAPLESESKAIPGSSSRRDIVDSREKSVVVKTKEKLPAEPGSSEFLRNPPHADRRVFDWRAKIEAVQTQPQTYSPSSVVGETQIEIMKNTPRSTSDTSDIEEQTTKSSQSSPSSIFSSLHQSDDGSMTTVSFQPFPRRNDIARANMEVIERELARVRKEIRQLSEGHGSMTTVSSQSFPRHHYIARENMEVTDALWRDASARFRSQSERRRVSVGQGFENSTSAVMERVRNQFYNFPSNLLISDSKEQCWSAEHEMWREYNEALQPIIEAPLEIEMQAEVLSDEETSKPESSEPVDGPRFLPVMRTDIMLWVNFIVKEHEPTPEDLGKMVIRQEWWQQVQLPSRIPSFEWWDIILWHFVSDCSSKTQFVVRSSETTMWEPGPDGWTQAKKVLVGKRAVNGEEFQRILDYFREELTTGRPVGIQVVYERW